MLCEQASLSISVLQIVAPLAHGLWLQLLHTVLCLLFTIPVFCKRRPPSEVWRQLLKGTAWSPHQIPHPIKVVLMLWLPDVGPDNNANFSLSETVIQKDIVHAIMKGESSAVSVSEAILAIQDNVSLDGLDCQSPK